MRSGPAGGPDGPPRGRASVQVRWFRGSALARLAPQPPGASDVVVELELVRVRAQLHGGDLVGALVVDPRLDQVRREDVADRQELVVGLERIEDGAERGRDLVD